MSDPQLKHEVDTVLNTWSQGSYMSGDFYGVFYKGKQMVVSKKRIYKQPGRAKAELISTLRGVVWQSLNKGLKYNDPGYVSDDKVATKVTREIVEELITDGVIEIKKV